MNKHWLTRNNNDGLILFFNGWAMDSAAVEHLDCTGYDILMFSDYTKLESISSSFSSYSSVYVVAWSLGVWAASHILDLCPINISRTIAINGTLKPIDNFQGIPESIFEGTLTGWSEKTRRRFYMRISGGAKEYLQNQQKLSTRDIENQKMELNSIYKREKLSEAINLTVDKAIVGNRDAIFPVANQLRHWKGKVPFITLDIPHYPFLHFTSWEQIIQI